MDDSLIWFILFIVFFTIEIFAPGIILVFFAFGALIVSITEIFIDLNTEIEISLFLISSFASLGFLRTKIKDALKSRKDKLLSNDDYVGKKVIVVQSLVGSGLGKVELHGTNWNAISEDDLEVGEEAIVIERENITLKVAKIDFN